MSAAFLVPAEVGGKMKWPWLQMLMENVTMSPDFEPETRRWVASYRNGMVLSVDGGRVAM